MKKQFLVLLLLAATAASNANPGKHPDRPLTDGKKPLILPFYITEPALEAENRQFIRASVRKAADVKRRKMATMKACKEKPEACRPNGRKIPAKQA